MRLTTSWSAPSRPGWQPGTFSRRQVPAFPCRSPNHARATYMPDTTWAVSRYPPDSSQRQDQPPVLMPSELSTLQRWFTRARLLDPYLTRSRHAVSASLPTPALNRRSMRWFEATPCRAGPEGLPPSPAQLHTSSRTRSTSASPLRARGTRSWGDPLRTPPGPPRRGEHEEVHRDGGQMTRRRRGPSGAGDRAVSLPVDPRGRRPRAVVAGSGPAGPRGRRAGALTAPVDPAAAKRAVLLVAATDDTPEYDAQNRRQGKPSYDCAQCQCDPGAQAHSTPLRRGNW